MSTPEEIRAKLRELGYLKSPLNRFVFGAGGSGGALRLALGAGGRGALIAGPLIGLFTIVLFGHELAADERLSWFLACSLLAGVIVLAWVVAQALALHALARLRGRMVESLPAVAVILSGITFLLPALLWLLASRRIQSEALREGALAPLALATALLLGASATAFAATRAADVFALNTFTWLQPRQGLRSIVFASLFAASVTGVLWSVVQKSTPTKRITSSPYERRVDARSRHMDVIAVDGVRSDELRLGKPFDGSTPSARAAWPDSRFVKLLEYPAEENLIAFWMKVQSGTVDWKGFDLQGYRPIWGGRAYAVDTAVGRFLELLNAVGLARRAALPNRKDRPLYFWEMVNPAQTRVIGGWHTYPLGTGSTIFSDRFFFALSGPTRQKWVQEVDEAPQLVSLDGLGHYYRTPTPLKLTRGYELETDPRMTDGLRMKLLYLHDGGMSENPELRWSYLPDLDIVHDKSPSQFELHRWLLSMSLKSGYLHDTDTLIIENPGRRGGTGAIWLKSTQPHPTIRPIHAPEEVAAAVLDYLGYPLAADLAGVKPEEAQLPTYGTVTLEDPGDDSDDATLKALKQLGYIQ